MENNFKEEATHVREIKIKKMVSSICKRLYKKNYTLPLYRVKGERQNIKS